MRLFVRASLTPAGQRFLQHAKTLALTMEQARHDVGLPCHYRASPRVGGRIALWEDFVPGRVGWMRHTHRTCPFAARSVSRIRWV